MRRLYPYIAGIMMLFTTACEKFKYSGNMPHDKVQPVGKQQDTAKESITRYDFPIEHYQTIDIDSVAIQKRINRLFNFHEQPLHQKATQNLPQEQQELHKLALQYQLFILGTEKSEELINHIGGPRLSGLEEAVLTVNTILPDELIKKGQVSFDKQTTPATNLEELQQYILTQEKSYSAQVLLKAISNTGVLPYQWIDTESPSKIYIDSANEGEVNKKVLDIYEVELETSTVSEEYLLAFQEFRNDLSTFYGSLEEGKTIEELQQSYFSRLFDIDSAEAANTYKDFIASRNINYLDALAQLNFEAFMN